MRYGKLIQRLISKDVTSCLCNRCRVLGLDAVIAMKEDPGATGALDIYTYHVESCLRHRYVPHA